MSKHLTSAVLDAIEDKLAHDATLCRAFAEWVSDWAADTQLSDKDRALVGAYMEWNRELTLFVSRVEELTLS